MDIKKIIDNTFEFILKRFIESLGILTILFSLFLLISLLSYSPEDPNFIFADKQNIKNLMGFKGSVIADLFFQSFGLTSILFPITLFFTGLYIFKIKKLSVILNNVFFSTIYLIFGSITFSIYYPNSFWMSVNGNGGFVGNVIKETFLIKNKMIESDFFLISLFLFCIILFLLSVNFKINHLKIFLNLFINFFTKRSNNFKSKEFQSNLADPIENEQVPVQEDFKFNKFVNNDSNRNISFKLPTLDFLNQPDKNDKNLLSSKNKIESGFLEKILLDFGVEGKIKKVSQGPVVTLNEFEPAAGIKVSKIINLSDDIARNTSSESARISTIPGQNTIGIELPNLYRENVYLREILSSPDFSKKDFKLPIALGKSISGKPIIGDLTTMPHLLIAGTTGSGKSVCINTIILSMLYRLSPAKCKFIMIDPKMLELSTYEDIPHLISPVITQPKKAASVLGWVVKEMESRYRLMTKENVRNIDGYNSKHKLAMPYIIVIVDEMSDLMLLAGKEIEGYIQKLSQMARAAGIHIIMATQRPSVDVITGTIKANFPTRISFQVSSKIDSRTILGEQGAEQLLGKGDMLFMSSANKMVRIHSPFVSEQEIEKVNNFLRKQQEPDYVDEILNFGDQNETSNDFKNNNDKDDLYNDALNLILSEKKASTSFLQRKLQIGYNRAARIIDMMEDEGVVSKANHVGKREVLK